MRRRLESNLLLLHKLGTKRSLLIAVLSFTVAVMIDVAEGGNVSTMPFYLLVVLLVVWNCGVKWGSIFLLASVTAALGVGEFFGHPFVSRGLFFVDVAGRFLVYLIMMLIAGMARRAFDREQALARSDVLTGLANRNAFYERLEYEIERQKRSGRPMALTYIDCDNFKSINDQMGHAAGDKFLQDVAKILLDRLRNTDMPARLGGDEFVLLFPETDASEAATAIDNLRTALCEIPYAGNGMVGFSFGVVVARDTPKSADWLVDQADQLMFSVKRAGKNSVRQRILNTTE